MVRARARDCLSSELRGLPMIYRWAGHMTSVPPFPPLLAGSNRSLTLRVV